MHARPPQSSLFLSRLFIVTWSLLWSLLCLLVRVVIQVQGIPAQVQVPPLLTMENMINIVLYNCRGFRSSSDYVKELLKHYDILCLQEHWLPDLQLNDLNGSDDFVIVAGSYRGL